jgi:hypothetical protein
LCADALPTGREAGIKFGDEPAIDARNAAGFGCGFVTRVAFTRYAVQARKSWMVERASTFFEVFLTILDNDYWPL